MILPLLAQISSILKLQQQYRGTTEQDQAHGKELVLDSVLPHASSALLATKLHFQT